MILRVLGIKKMSELEKIMAPVQRRLDRFRANGSEEQREALKKFNSHLCNANFFGALYIAEEKGFPKPILKYLAKEKTQMKIEIYHRNRYERSQQNGS